MNEKQQETILRLRKNRQKLTNKIKSIIGDKLVWVEDEIKKGQTLIEQYKNQITKVQIDILKLQGAQTALQDLLEEVDKRLNIEEG